MRNLVAGVPLEGDVKFMPAHTLGHFWRSRKKEVDEWVRPERAASRASRQRARK